MIGLVSIKGTEPTTDNLIDWLIHYNLSFKRITSHDISRLSDFTLGSVTHGETLDSELKSIRALWFRRWDVMKDEHQELSSSDLPPSTRIRLEKAIGQHIHQENRKCREYFFSLLKHAKWINPQGFPDINKIKVLDIAAAAGLKVPPTLLANHRAQVECFMNKYGILIKKSMSEGLVFVDDERNQLYAMYTETVDAATLENLPEQFAMSLFQKSIAKEFEIRSFYLAGEFHSMAIFSQKNPKTAVDFRRYDSKQGNRFVPFKLPDEIAASLKKVYEELNLTTGSSDMIKSEDGEYYFLEINPVGQFGMVSYPCNYML